jgi:hypothetical protein
MKFKLILAEPEHHSPEFPQQQTEGLVTGDHHCQCPLSKSASGSVPMRLSVTVHLQFRPLQYYAHY